MGESFDVRSLLSSFKFALAGLRALFVHEHNARIHGLIAGAVIVLGLWLGIQSSEWAILILAMAVVFCAEAANTALEALADAVHPERHPMIARAKDVAAAGVLIAAVLAAAVGLLILGPPLWQACVG